MISVCQSGKFAYKTRLYHIEIQSGTLELQTGTLDLQIGYLTLRKYERISFNIIENLQ